SPSFPTTADAPQRSYGGSGDAFVAKFGPDGTLRFATYLGGSGADEGRGIAVDKSGNILVDGMTSSLDFPSAGAALEGVRDGFLVKLAPTGSVVFAHLIGGSGMDSALALSLDSFGSSYLTGETDSADFPTTL